MFGRKLKFASLVFGGCLFQFFPFFGCSNNFVEAVLKAFTPAFGESLGIGLGTSLTTNTLGDLLNNLVNSVTGTAA